MITSDRYFLSLLLEAKIENGLFRHQLLNRIF
jgi:hypothetical protein